MKKTLKMIKGAMLVGSFVMAFNTASAFAANTTESSSTENTSEQSGEDDNVLTVEEATERAIKYSKELKTMSESISLAQDDEKDTNRDLFYASEYNEVTSLAVQLKNLQNNIKNYMANSEVTKQSLELSVIQMFTSIIEAENSLELCDKQLELSQKDLELAELKVQLGLMTENEYNTEKNTYNKIETQRDTISISLDKAYTSLNRILGYDLDEKYAVKLDTEYTPFEETMPLETKILKAIASSQTISEKEDSVAVAKYELDVYSSLYSNEKKESKQNSYNKASRELDDAKTNLRINITDLYNSIQTMEKQYNDNLAELEQMKTELAVKEVQYSLGKITLLELEKYQYEISSLENTIQNQVYDHDILLRKYENPDLI